MFDNIAQKVRVVYNEGYQRPLHGRRIRRRQHGDVRTIDEKFTVLGRRHHRTDGVRLHLRRQVHRLGCLTVSLSASVYKQLNAQLRRLSHERKIYHLRPRKSNYIALKV